MRLEYLLKRRCKVFYFFKQWPYDFLGKAFELPEIHFYNLGTHARLYLKCGYVNAAFCNRFPNNKSNKVGHKVVRLRFYNSHRRGDVNCLCITTLRAYATALRHALRTLLAVGLTPFY